MAANRARLQAAGLPPFATQSVAHWDDLLRRGHFAPEEDPSHFSIGDLSADQYTVLVDVVESYFLAGYEYFAPTALKAEDQVRLTSRFGTTGELLSVEIRMLGHEERAMLARVAPDVFDNAIDDEWCMAFFEDPRHHLAVALDGAVVVGFASAVHYVHPDKPPELWINEVGVAPSHQQQGLGRRLLAVLLDHARALGCVQAWVLTSPTNTAAQRLYAAAGGQVASEPALLFEFPLRPGPR